MKILLLNAPYGNGHKYCSSALKIAFEQKGCDVIELDYYENFCNKNLVTVSKNFHKNSFTWWGKPAYMFGYVASNKFFMPKISARSAIGKIKFEQYLLEHNIKKVIITFPIAAILDLSIKYPEIDFYEVVTDFSLHKKWQNPNLKAIFLGSKDLQKKFSYLTNTIVSGIPVKDAQILPNKVNLFKGNHKTISIILGANGSITSNLDFIDKISTKYHINVICGTNKELYKKLNLKYESSQHVNIWGFIKDVENLYEASDLVITKSGGMTCSELIHYKTKALFFIPQYGQERDNALFFEKYNLGKILNIKTSINRQINFVFSLDAKFSKVYIPNSKDIICNKVLENEN